MNFFRWPGVWALAISFSAQLYAVKAIRQESHTAFLSPISAKNNNGGAIQESIGWSVPSPMHAKRNSALHYSSDGKVSKKDKNDEVLPVYQTVAELDPDWYETFVINVLGADKAKEIGLPQPLPPSARSKPLQKPLKVMQEKIDSTDESKVLSVDSTFETESSKDAPSAVANTPILKTENNKISDIDIDIDVDTKFDLEQSDKPTTDEATMVVLYEEVSSCTLQSVPLSNLTQLGYTISDIQLLQSDVIALVVADEVRMPRTGIPPQWKRPVSQQASDKSDASDKKSIAQIVLPEDAATMLAAAKIVESKYKQQQQQEKQTKESKVATEKAVTAMKKKPTSASSTKIKGAVTTQDTSLQSLSTEDLVVAYKDPVSGLLVAVPLADYITLGYAKEEIVLLQPDILDLIVAGQVVRPRSELPPNWRQLGSKSKNEIQVLTKGTFVQMQNKNESKEAATSTENEEQEDSAIKPSLTQTDLNTTQEPPTAKVAPVSASVPMKSTEKEVDDPELNAATLTQTDLNTTQEPPTANVAPVIVSVPIMESTEKEIDDPEVSTAFLPQSDLKTTTTEPAKAEAELAPVSVSMPIESIEKESDDPEFSKGQKMVDSPEKLAQTIRVTKLTAETNETDDANGTKPTAVSFDTTKSGAKKTSDDVSLGIISTDATRHYESSKPDIPEPKATTGGEVKKGQSVKTAKEKKVISKAPVDSNERPARIGSQDMDEQKVVVFFDYAKSRKQAVPVSKLISLGYTVGDVADLQADVLATILADSTTKPRTGIPPQWRISKAKPGFVEPEDVQLLSRLDAEKAMEIAPSKSSKIPPLDREAPERTPGKTSRKRTPRSASEPKRRRRPEDRSREKRALNTDGSRKSVYSVRGGSPKDSKRRKADPPTPQLFWMDIDTFRDLLRTEAEMRVSIVGDSFSEAIKDESDWRLNLYKDWLWTLDKGIGKPIVPSRRDRTMQVPTPRSKKKGSGGKPGPKSRSPRRSRNNNP